MRKESNLHPIVVSKMAELIANRKSTSEGLDLDPKIGYFEDEFITSTFLMEEEEQEQLIRLYTEHVAGVKLPTDWENNLVARRSFLDNVGRTLNNGSPVPSDGVNFWHSLHQSIPDLLTEADLLWLVNNDPTGSGGFVLLCHIINYNPRSRLLEEVMNSIHAWK